jgi:hypothetical protein
MAEAQPVRLMAKDAEDLAVVASCLQDALVPLSEMRFLKGEKRFVMLLNRFRWERAGDPAKSNGSGSAMGGDASFADAGTGNQRINSGLCVDGVTGVRSRGIDLAKPAKFLNLITVGLASSDQGGQSTLNLVFSGDGVIQLEIEKTSVFLQDFGEAWPTQWRPDHDGRAAK